MVRFTSNGALDASFGRVLSSKPVVSRLAGNRQTVDLLEYYHAGFDHFFLTSLADEIQKLDDGTFTGWARTGQSITALAQGATGTFSVCRFFSATFAPKSSHFYTPYVSECDALKAGTTWTHEGDVFALQIPAANGSCPADTRRVFRAYNNGIGGAPNHPLTVSDDVRSARSASGWTAEGVGSPPVFACVPL